MARTKFKNITIEYAGQDLLDGGMFAEVQGALNGSTRYTTQAVAHLGAAAVALDECGNLSREGSLSVAVDYDSEAEMLADVLARQGFADAHQRAVLRMAVDGTGERAMGYFICVPDNYEVGGTLKLMRGGEVAFEHVFEPPQGAGWTLAGIKAALEGDPLWRCEITDEESEVDFYAPEVGAAWNDVELVLEGELFGNGNVYHGGMDSGVDEVAQACNAALSGFNYSSTLAGRGLRVVYEYSFILGAAADGV